LHKGLKCFTHNVSYEVTYGFRLDFKWYYISVFHDKWHGDVHFLTETFNVFIYLNVNGGGGGIFFPNAARRILQSKKQNNAKTRQVVFYFIFVHSSWAAKVFGFFSPRFINESRRMTLRRRMYTFQYIVYVVI